MGQTLCRGIGSPSVCLRFGRSLALIFAITAVAVVALVAFAMVPFFSVNNLFDNLFDIPATDAAGSSAFLPFSYNRRKSQRKSWAI